MSSHYEQDSQVYPRVESGLQLKTFSVPIVEWKMVHKAYKDLDACYDTRKQFPPLYSKVSVLGVFAV